MGDLWIPQCDLHRADQGDQAGENGFTVACVVRQERRQTAADERQKQ
jgi:hypothetical protein